MVLLECLEGGVFCLGVHRDFPKASLWLLRCFTAPWGITSIHPGAAGQNLQLENKLGAGFTLRFQTRVTVTLSLS